MPPSVVLGSITDTNGTSGSSWPASVVQIPAGPSVEALTLSLVHPAVHARTQTANP
jgi:hypothetical protein